MQRTTDVKFPKLIIENFLAITQAELNLSDRGLMLVQGVNNDDTSADSNGAGKSSIADAPCWCLYGTTARGATGDDVVNETAGKNCRVETHVHDGSSTFVITRHRKHKTGKNSLTVVQHEVTIGGIKTTDLTKGTDKLTQEVVDKIIGASQDVFTASIYSGYEQMPNLPAMTDKNLKVMIEEASGTTLLEEAYEEARKRLNTHKTTLATAELVLAQKRSNLLALESQRVSAVTDQADWQSRQAFKIANESTNLKSMHASYQALVAKTNPLDPESIKTEIAGAKQRIAAVATQQTELTQLQQDLKAVELKMTGVEIALDGNQAARLRKEGELQKIEHKVGCACDSCGRPLTATEVGPAKQKIQEFLDAYDKAIKEDEDKQDILIVELGEAKKKIVAHQASMTDVSVETELISKKTAELSEIERLLAETVHAGSLVKNLAVSIKAMQAEKNPFDAMIERVDQAIIATKSDITKDELEVIRAQADVDIANAVVSVFAPAGVRAVILDEVTPYLNQQTSKYLSILSDGNIYANWSTLVPDAKGNMKEKFTIEVENSKGAKSFVGLSGGEKRKVRLSTALALQDLVATRAIKPIDLYIGDEIDDALDDAGLERLTQILDEKADERGTVLIISHKALTDWISNVIQIEKQPGGLTKITEMTV